MGAASAANGDEHKVLVGAASAANRDEYKVLVGAASAANRDQYKVLVGAASAANAFRLAEATCGSGFSRECQTPIMSLWDSSGA